MGIELTKSSGNVFVDLGFPAEQAENLKVRSELMDHVINVIESRELTQREAARAMGLKNRSAISRQTSGWKEMLNVLICYFKGWPF